MSEDCSIDELLQCPGVFIPCEDLETLQILIYELFDKEVLEDEETFLLKNVPGNMLEILADPDYFNREEDEEQEVCGIVLVRGDTKFLDKCLDEML